MTLHVHPVGDVSEHDVETEGIECSCPCEPRVEFYDPETGKVYAEMLVIHNSFDGRERLEASDA